MDPPPLQFQAAQPQLAMPKADEANPTQILQVCRPSEDCPPKPTQTVLFMEGHPSIPLGKCQEKDLKQTSTKLPGTLHTKEPQSGRYQECRGEPEGA